MTRDRAQKAVDDGFDEGVKNLFIGLTRSLMTGEADGIEKFARGIAFYDEAHAKASVEIERIFPA